MAETKLKFQIGSVFNGEGFQKASQALEKTSKQVQKASGGIAQITGELGKMNGTVGKVAGGLSNLVGSLAMGPWGIAAAGIGLVVGGLMSWREEAEKTRQKNAEMAREAEEAYKRRLAHYAEVARKAEIAALDAIIAKGKQAIEWINTRATAYRTLASAADALRKSEERIAVAQAEQIGGPEGKRKVLNIQNEAAKRSATEDWKNAVSERDDLQQKLPHLREVMETMAKKGEDVTKMQMEIETTEAKLKAAEERVIVTWNNYNAVCLENQNRTKALEDEIARAAKAEAEAKERAAKAAKDEADRRKAEQDRIEKANRKQAERMEAEMAIEDAQSAGEAKVQSLDERIAAAQKSLRSWEEAAALMRGKNFSDWLKEDSASGKSEDGFAKANASAEKKARRIRANSRHGWASARELEWLGKYDKWSAAQDPNNNPAAKTLEELQRERTEALKQTKQTVKDIRDYIKYAITPES